MFQVQLVLHELDDGEQELRVAKPAEHVFEDGEVLVLHPLGQAVAEGREDDDGHLLVFRLDLACDVKHVAAAGSRHADDQFEGVALQLSLCLLE